MRLKDSVASGRRDVRFLGGALNRDAPFEVAERGHRLDEPGMGEHHAVGEDDDVLEAEIHRLGQRLEEALVDGRLAAQEGEVGGAGGARVFQCLDDRLDRHRAGDLHRRQLAARAEDAAVVAEVPELDLEAVPVTRGGDGRRRAPILFGDVHGHERMDRRPHRHNRARRLRFPAVNGGAEVST